MPLQTPRGVPFPADFDPPVVASDFQSLAEWIDVHPGIETISEPERNELSGPDRWVGRMIYNLTRLRAEIWDGAGWTVPSPGAHDTLLGREALDAHYQYVTHDRFNSHDHTGGESSYLGHTMADAKGDLLLGSSPDTISRQAVGQPGQALVADPSSGTGVRWADAGRSMGCRVIKSIGRSQEIHGGWNDLPSGASDVIVFQPYGDEDPNGLYSAERMSTIQIPPGYGGRWHVQCSVAWESNPTGTRLTRLFKGWVTLGDPCVARVQNGAALGGTLVQQISTTVRCAPYDMLQVVGYQTSGDVLSVLARDAADTWFSANFLGA